jgi:zinc transporter ZupT
MALTGGVVVAVAIFDVLPESIDAVDDAQRVALLVGLGFIVFFIAERLLVLHHRDDPEQARAHAQVGALGAFGLSIHSFIDGLGIGLAFGLDTATGVLVFIAVVSHDFADGLNTVSFVLSQSHDRHRPPSRGARRPRVVGTRRAHGGRLRGDLRDHADRAGLRRP